MALAALIGKAVSVTLVNTKSYEGVVFSYSEADGVLVLYCQPEGTSPVASPASGRESAVARGFKVINGSFITAVAPLAGCTYTLPSGLAADASLPALEVSDYKKFAPKLREAMKKREGLYHPSATIDACEAFDKVGRVWNVTWVFDDATLATAGVPDAENPSEPRPVLLVNKSVIVSGHAANATWKTPAIVSSTNSAADASMIDRLKRMFGQ
jgi:hypothetical protein